MNTKSWESRPFQGVKLVTRQIYGIYLPLTPQTGQCVSLGNINTMSKSHEKKLDRLKHKKQHSKMEIYPLNFDPVLNGFFGSSLKLHGFPVVDKHCTPTLSP